MPKRLLNPPEVVRQGEGYKCWAAALASWLRATPGRKQRDMDWLLSYSAPFKQAAEQFTEEKLRMPPGAINAEIFKKMLVDPELDLRMDYEEHSKGTMLADDHLYQTMAWYGGLLLVVYTPTGQGRNMTRHANVIFGASDDGLVMVMEPQLGRLMGKHKDSFGTPLLLAYREPTRNPDSDVVPLRHPIAKPYDPRGRIR